MLMSSRLELVASNPRNPRHYECPRNPKLPQNKKSVLGLDQFFFLA